jgi:hypothetical protein
MKTNNLITIFIASMLLASCGAHRRAEWHLKRAFALEPGMKESKFAYIQDTFVIKGQNIVDTVTLTETDTVKIGNDTVETFIYKYEDRWVVRTKVKPQVVYKEVKVPVTIIKCPEESLGKRYWWQILLVVTSVIGVKAIIDRK